MIPGSPWTYPLITASIAGSAVLPALPSESILAAAMSLAAAGELHLTTVCLAATIGAVLGDLAAFTVGRILGGRAHSRAAVSAHGQAAVRWLRERERSWGPVLVVGGRFLPGGTMAVGISAGLLRYPLRRFMLFSVIGATLWTGSGAAVGFLGHAVFPDDTWAGVLLAIGIVLAVAGAAHLTHRHRRRRRGSRHDNRSVSGRQVPAGTCAVATARPRRRRRR